MGVTVAFGNHDELVAAITVCLRARTDPDLGRNLARAAQEFSWATEQRRLLDLYDRIEGRGRSHAS